MKKLKQLFALLQMSFSGLSQRVGASLVTVIGIACVVGVLVAMLSMGMGLRKMALQNARDDRVMVLSKGAQATFMSNMERGTARLAMDGPGVKKGADGKPLASALTMVIVEGRKRSDDKRTAYPLFAVDQNFANVYPEVQVTAGRMFTPALREVIVGKTRYEQTKGLEIGDTIHMRGGDWTVVGRFEANGGGMENGLIGDAETVISAFARNTTQAVKVVLESPSSFDAYSAALKSNPAMDVDVKREAEVLEQDFKQITKLLNFISYFVGTVMAIGATLGAINVMYAAVDSRKREIATLRAIGFSGGPIVLSVLVESIVLALPGALLGVLLAWLFFNGDTVSPVGISIKLAVTPTLAALGISWAILMGFIGGFMPAIRAARAEVATALRAV